MFAILLHVRHQPRPNLGRGMHCCNRGMRVYVRSICGEKTVTFQIARYVRYALRAFAFLARNSPKPLLFPFDVILMCSHHNYFGSPHSFNLTPQATRTHRPFCSRTHPHTHTHITPIHLQLRAIHTYLCRILSSMTSRRRSPVAWRSPAH